MNPLLAHHLEAHHVPVLIGLFAAGVYVGWHLVSRYWNRDASAIRPVNRQ